MRGLGEAAASAYGQQFYDNGGSDVQQAGLMMNDAFLNSQMNMVRGCGRKRRTSRGEVTRMRRSLTLRGCGLG
jgi:hypothetical protein